MSNDSGSHGKGRTRRRFIKTVGATGVVGLAGCTGDGGDGGGDGGSTGDSGGSANATIKYWTLFGGGDGKVMKSMVEKFNEEQPLGSGVTIDRQRLEWDAYYDKLFTSMTGGEAPDMAISHMSYMNRFGEVIEPFNDYIDIDQTKSEYLNSHWNSVFLDGELRAAPMDFHPAGIYYNKRIFEEAGVESEPSNWEEFKAAGDAIADNTDADAFVPSPYQDGVGSFRLWSGWVKSAGGSLFSDDLTEATFDNDAGLTCTEAFWDMTGDWGWTQPTGEENWGNKKFQNGELGMAANGTWYVNVMAELEDFDWGFFKPTVGPDNQEDAAWADGHSIIMPQSDSRDAEKTELTAKAAKWLTQENPEWGAEAGHLPATQRYYDEGVLEDSPYWDKTLSKFLEMAENEIYFPHPQVDGDPNTEQWWNWLIDVWAHNTEPAAALEAGQQRVNDAL